MGSPYLNRSDAPFAPEFWAALDSTIGNAVKSQLVGRRLLPIEGPFGLGFLSLSSPEKAVSDPSAPICVAAGESVPLISIACSFRLSSRDISGFEQGGPLRLESAARLAIECAHKEDQLIFHGWPGLPSPGLLNASGIHSASLRSWDQPGMALEDLTKAVSLLDQSGFRGPYTLALAPALYYKLFRLYPASSVMELDQLRSLFAEGIIKASNLESGGVVLAAGIPFASIVLGQDWYVGFEGPSGTGYNFFLSETIALKIAIPQSICALRQ